MEMEIKKYVFIQIKEEIKNKKAFKFTVNLKINQYNKLLLEYTLTRYYIFITSLR